MSTTQPDLECILASTDGVTIYDPSYRLLQWNNIYKGMGITPADAVNDGLSIRDTYRLAARLGVFGEGCPERTAADRLRGVYEKNAPAIEDLVSTDGRTIEVRRYFYPGVGVAAVFTDVTERRLRTAHRARASRIDLLTNISSRFAHDINNVLTVVAGKLEVAKANRDWNLVENAVESVIQASQITRPARTPAAHTKRTYSVANAISKIVPLCNCILPDTELRTTINVGRARAVGNDSALCSCVLNVVSYLEEVTSPDCQLSLTAEATDGSTRLIVQASDGGLTNETELSKRWLLDAIEFGESAGAVVTLTDVDATPVVSITLNTAI